MNDLIEVVGTLKDWRKHVCKADGTYVIWGYIYGDLLSRFHDGELIHTSAVATVIGDTVITMGGNAYRLDGEEAGPEINQWIDFC